LNCLKVKGKLNRIQINNMSMKVENYDYRK